MNFKSRPVFVKDDGVFKIIDDFRKIKMFEVDCAPSAGDYRSSFGNIRYGSSGNARLVNSLNGGFINIEDLNMDFLRKNHDFSSIMKKLAALSSSSLAISEAPFISMPITKQKSYETISSPVLASSSSRSTGQMIICPDYPLNLEVLNFNVLHELRYSCGWRLECEPLESIIRYKYELFDLNMIYEMMKVDDISPSIKMDNDESKVLNRDGQYVITIYIPYSSREQKAQIYNIIKEEARVWDSIVALCYQILLKIDNFENLTSYLHPKKELVDKLIDKISDQKATK